MAFGLQERSGSVVRVRAPVSGPLLVDQPTCTVVAPGRHRGPVTGGEELRGGVVLVPHGLAVRSTDGCQTPAVVALEDGLAAVGGVADEGPVVVLPRLGERSGDGPGQATVSVVPERRLGEVRPTDGGQDATAATVELGPHPVRGDHCALVARRVVLPPGRRAPTGTRRGASEEFVPALRAPNGGQGARRLDASGR